jgi:hypothetical protein
MATIYIETLSCRLDGRNDVNLSRLFDKIKHQENHFLQCPFIAIYDLSIGHLSPLQLEYAIADAFSYAEACKNKDLDLVSALLLRHPKGREIEPSHATPVKDKTGLGCLLCHGFCRNTHFWTNEDRLKIVTMFFAHPNGKKIPAFYLKTIAKYLHKTQNYDTAVAEVIARHPNTENMSNCTIL